MADCIFTKYSNERSRAFAIRTDIMEEDGSRFVVKRPLYPEGAAHMKNLLKWGSALTEIYKEISMSANRCEHCEDGVRLEYVEGETLETVLDGLLMKGKTAEAQERLCLYLKQIQTICSKVDFSVTDGFKKVFGYVRLPEGLRSGTVTNIDMVCGNLVLGEIPTVLDYEWTFDFPIPCHYVLWRVIYYYTHTHRLRQVLDEKGLYGAFGISKEERAVYRRMEEHFQNYITGSHVPVRELYSDMCPGIMEMYMVAQEYLQVYFSFGEGYCEEQSVRLPVNKWEIECSVDIPPDCTHIRLDPGNGGYAAEFLRVAMDGRPVSLEGCPVRGGVLLGRILYAVDNDPGIENIPVPKNAEMLTVHVKLHQAAFEVQKKVYDQARLIDDMRGTKVWKLYESYRKKVERK